MKKFLPIVFVVFWGAAFCFPHAARLVLRKIGAVSWEEFNGADENRNPALRPTLFRNPRRHVALKDLGSRYEAWFADAFPWRTELLRFHREKAFHWLKTPVGREVPGYGNWVFRRGGDWPELDDYLGAIELTPGETADWITLFEGRREWAHALGTVFLTVPATTKAQARWQELYPAVRNHRGRNVGAQIREALASSPARDDVLFADDDFAAAFESGRETFYDVDHHPSAYGEWLLYERINRRLRELFPDRVGASLPWYDDPPAAVLEGREAGCWERNIRLEVSSPGETQDNDGVDHNAKRFPFCNVATVRAGGGISVLFAHDSFMRFSLASWRGRDGDVRLPFAQGVGRVRAFIFKRVTPGFLESVTTEEIPDVLIEQFPACRLDDSAHKYLDDGTRAAAAFGRAATPSLERAPRAGDRIAARVVLDGVRDNSPNGKACIAVLRCGNREIGRRSLLPGVKRAVFFDPVTLAEDAPLSVALKGCEADSTNLVWRLVP